MRTTRLAFFSAVLLVLAEATAFADAGQGARLKKEADAMMDAGRFAEAAQLYARAYEASSDPGALYNEGRALEALGEYPEAILRLEKFRAVAPPALRARTSGLDDHIANLRSRVGKIVVTSNVRGARLLVRSRDVGVLDPTLEVFSRAGPTTIEVTADGYETWRKEIELRAKETTAIEAQLVPRGAVVAVRSRPDGASVAVDGRPWGLSPLEVKVTPGPHVVRLSKDGFSDESVDINVASGDRRELDVPLKTVGPITSKWWFWTAIGVAVAASATVIIVAATSGGSEATGDFQPGRVQAPLGISF
jgi:hypothetical protein